MAVQRVTDKDDPRSDGDAPAPKPAPLAVALKHDRKGAAAPRVVATGRGGVAEQILQIAFANGVKVREDADLAEILALVEQDSEIPVAAFAAVAEILTYVYRLNAAAEPPAGEKVEDP